MEHRKAKRAILPNFPSESQARFRVKLEQLELESGEPPLLPSLFGSVNDGVGFPRLSLRSAAFLLASCLTVFFLIRLNSAPPVSAQELLQRTENAEAQRIAQVSIPVVYRKLQVRRSSSNSPAPRREESVSWEIWNDTSNKRFKERIGGPNERQLNIPGKDSAVIGDRHQQFAKVPPILTELEQVFQANHMDWRMPLSPGAYAAWRRSISVKSEETNETKLTDGDKALALKTAGAGPFAPNGIIQNELVVRAEDWHPVEQRLKVQEENGVWDYQLTEADYRILALNTLTPSIFADLNPPSTPIPRAPTAASLSTAGAAGSIAAEMKVHYALHRVKACLGEPIELVRDLSGRIEVRGLAATRERKEELLAALQGLPHVTANIQVIEGAVKAAPSSLPQLSSEEIRQEAASSEEHLIQVRTARLPIQDQLERYFTEQENEPTAGKRQAGEKPAHLSVRMAEFSNQVVALSDAALAEAWALRRLAEKYPRLKSDDLPPATRWLLEVMVRDHITDLRTQIDRSRMLLEPVLTSIAEKSEGTVDTKETQPSDALSGTDSVWTAEVLRLFSTVKHIQQVTAWLLAGGALPAGPEENPIVNVLAAFHQAESELANFERRVAREFSSRPNLLTMQDQLESETNERGKK
jgi:hypothetical protein